MSSIRVFYWALGRASRKTWIFKARHVFFFAPGEVVSKKNRREKGVIKNDETCL